MFIALTTLLYVFDDPRIGLRVGKDGPKLFFYAWRDWLQAAHYSFRVMAFLRPDDFTPIGYGKVVHTVQSLLGPLLFGLFALAVRQRLKR